MCRRGELTIGAPSSPILSNAILFDFDTAISALCEKNNVTYSRYADDLFFSTNEPFVLNTIEKNVREYLSTTQHPRLSLNEKKTVYTSRKKRRLVTGLTLTSDNKISVGREKKRFIKHLCHQFQIGALSPEDVSHLAGYLSFLKAVEPAFIDSLKRKYGPDMLVKLAHGPRTSRKADSFQETLTLLLKD